MRLAVQKNLHGSSRPQCRNGASEGIRTLDTHVGNVMLYQAELRSLPNKPAQITENRSERKQSFKRGVTAICRPRAALRAQVSPVRLVPNCQSWAAPPPSVPMSG